VARPTTIKKGEKLAAVRMAGQAGDEEMADAGPPSSQPSHSQFQSQSSAADPGFGLGPESAEDAARRARGAAMKRQASVFTESVEADLPTAADLEAARTEAQTEDGAPADERLSVLTQSWGTSGAESRFLAVPGKRTFEDLTAAGGRKKGGRKAPAAAARPAQQRKLSSSGRQTSSGVALLAGGQDEKAAGVSPLLRQISWFGPRNPDAISPVSGTDEYAAYGISLGDSDPSDDEYYGSDDDAVSFPATLKDPYEAGARNRALVLLPDPRLKTEDIFADVAEIEKARLELAEKEADAADAKRPQHPPGLGAGFGFAAGWGAPPARPEQGQSNDHVLMVDVSFPYGGRPQRLQQAKGLTSWETRRRAAVRQQRKRKTPRFVVPDILMHTANHPESLNALPRDIIADILLRLPLRDTVNLSEVSRHCRECATGDVIWLHHLKRDYADFVHQNKVRLVYGNAQDSERDVVSPYDDTLPQIVSTHFSRTPLRQLYAALSRQYVSVLGIPINDIPARVKEISDPEKRARQAARNLTNGVEPFFVLHLGVPKTRAAQPQWEVIDDAQSVFGKSLTMSSTSGFNTIKVAGSCIVHVPCKYVVMWRVRSENRWNRFNQAGVLEPFVGSKFTTTCFAPLPEGMAPGEKGKEIFRKEFELERDETDLIQAGRNRSSFVLLSVAEIVVDEPGTRVAFEFFSSEMVGVPLSIDAVRLYPMTDTIG
jgi:F-box domain